MVFLPKTPVDEAELRAAYEAGALSLGALARRFHIGAKRLENLAQSGGWSRPAKMSARRKTATRKPKRPARKRAAQGQGRLLLRVRALLERAITMLEEQMPADLAESERWGRALATVAKCVQGLDEIAAPVAPVAGTQEESPDERRADLERRLAALLGCEEEEGNPPQPDGAGS
jgi:hypothetical protein